MTSNQPDADLPGRQVTVAATPPAGDPLMPMAVIGWLTLVGGIATVITALVLPTTVPSTGVGSMIGDTYVPGPATDTFNMGLLQRQLLVFGTGLAAIVLGAVLLVGAKLLSAIQPPVAAPETAASVATPPEVGLATALGAPADPENRPVKEGWW